MGRGGGKADASDLKSDKLKGLCGFDSHPRHHDEWFDWLDEDDYEHDYESPYDYGYNGDALTW